MMNLKRRAFGQHFLKDLSVVSQIVQTSCDWILKSQCNTVLEIGPGKGALTFPLMRLLKERVAAFKAENYIAVEKDPQLAELLKGERLIVKVEDFLRVPAECWVKEEPIAVVSNLPYSVATQILARLAGFYREIRVMVLMFQEEVAERIRAELGTKNQRHLGSLSIWIQNRWNVQKIISVQPSAFSPPPAVRSEVLLMIPRQSPQVLVEPEDEKEWLSFLRDCFSHRRKMLRSLSFLKNILERSGIDGTKRPEALIWTEWERLWKAKKS